MASEAVPEMADNATTSKRFKACRTCKRQKMKCEGPDHAPCKRCRNARTECIFDLIDSTKRPQKRPMEDELLHSEKFRSLEQEIKELRGAIQSLTRVTSQSAFGDIPLEVEPSNDRRVRPRTDAVADLDSSSNAVLLTVDNSNQGIEPRLDTTIAKAIQNRSHSEPRDWNPAQSGSSPRHTLLSVETPPVSPNSNQVAGDLISRGLLSLPVARELFERFVLSLTKNSAHVARFQARCNLWLPLFDHCIDTFESIRSRSSFCFTAILAISSRLTYPGRVDSALDEEVCQSEAQTLAAKTLFDGTPKLETIQAMVLLAAYSQKCWYAIGHAVRLAQRMRLGDSLSRLVMLRESDSDHSNAASLNRMARIERAELMRQIRVWMTLAHLEQEIASGLGRQSLIERDKRLNVRRLVDYPLYPVSEFHILAAVEFLRHRGEYESPMRFSYSLTCTDQLRAQLKSTQIEVQELLSENIFDVLDECLIFWDSVLEGISNKSDVS